MDEKFTVRSGGQLTRHVQTVISEDGRTVYGAQAGNIGVGKTDIDYRQ